MLALSSLLTLPGSNSETISCCVFIISSPLSEVCCAERLNLNVGDDNEVVISLVTTAKMQTVSQSVFLPGVFVDRCVSVLEVKV